MATNPATRPMPASSRAWWARPSLWAELFALSNVAFLAVDVYLAHSINRFEHPAEWVPVAYSLASPLVLIVALALGGLPPPTTAAIEGPGATRRRLGRALGMLVGWIGVAVGVAGLLFHLDSQFFALRTVKSLVYTAPFAAPLAYAGLGLLLLLDRKVADHTAEWASWVVLLALGGFIGNFALSLADHAQNGFFEVAEWIPVVSSAFAVGILVAVLAVPGNRPLLWLATGVMALQVVVGLIGAYLHVRANLGRPMETAWDNFLYGAPAFAPLLFADLAGLAVLGLWALGTSVTAELPATTGQIAPGETLDPA